ncbi:MAG: site-2 protease family protein [Clostridia bacterium]|nr:site-2 protease family protein [Clostridia bacterium]
MKAKLKIKTGFFSLLLSLTLILTKPNYFPALFLSVFIHELGHLLGAKLCRVTIKELKLGIFGAGLSPKDALISYKKEIVLCLLGPLANFLSILAAHMIIPRSLLDNEFFSNFLMSSLALGVLNLLPVESFDGGRIFLSLLSLRLSPKLSGAIMSTISFIIIFTLWCLSVYLLLRISSSLSLFVFSSYLFAKIFIKDTL